MATQQRIVEFINPAGHMIVVAGPNGEQVHFSKFQRRTLSQWFSRYVPRYLRLANQPANVSNGNRAQTIQKQAVKPVVVTAKVRLPERKTLAINKPKQAMPTRIVPHKIVGRTAMHPEQARIYFREMLSRETFPISNDIGIGILSYNRKASISRLVESIRRFTDLTKTTVFISDESTDQTTKDYVRSIKDMVVLDNKERLGVAGNTNRLLRCLERFRFKVLLNDDVEITANDWEIFYPAVMTIISYHHFCQRMPGVYGANQYDGELKQIDKFKIQTIHEKPHGAIMVFDNVAFEKVGYFDESFGQYGMEHVDWSNRVSLSGVQPAGFHDVIGSNGFFKVHSDASAVESRASHLAEARHHYESIKNNTQRIYIAPTVKSEVPKLSYIIPFRGQDRFDAIRVTLLNIKAQRFPCLEIIMVEQDSSGFVNFPELAGVRKILAQSSGPFNKALAFNFGVANTTGKLLILHDADIMVGANYSQTVYHLLENYDSFHIGKRVLYLDHNSTMKMALQMKLTGDLAIERCVGYFEGGSLGCHFNTYSKIGGFCEEFVGYGCFCPGNFVLTELGYKRIENVLPSDMLYTHEGRFRGIKLRSRNYIGEILDVFVPGRLPIKGVTPEHPFLIADGAKFKWCKACDLKEGDQILDTDFIPELVKPYDLDDNSKNTSNMNEFCYLLRKIKPPVIGSSAFGRSKFGVIYKIKKRFYSGPVYNFEVNDDHSYIVNGLVSHNCEDCEFYSRLTQNSKFFGERSVDFVHLWHGRTSGWKDYHEKNKKLDSQLRLMPMEHRLKRVNNVLSKYGMRPR